MGCSSWSSAAGSTRATATVLVDQAFALHVDRDLQRGFRRALAGAGLEHEELAFLHREFHVLHVAVMRSPAAADGAQFGERLRASPLPCDGRLPALALAHDFGNRLRRADARHHVFALGVDQEFAVEQLFAGRRIAREGDAGGTCLAAIAEHHRLHRDRRAPVFGNVVQLAIGVGARTVP